MTDIECPLRPLKDQVYGDVVVREVPESVVVFTVPEKFHKCLAYVFAARREDSKGALPMPNGGAASKKWRKRENAYEKILSQMRHELGLPEEAILEFYSGWRYSITTLAQEKMLHDERKKRDEEKEKKKSSEKTGGKNGMSFKYQDEPPEHNHLIEYYARPFMEQYARLVIAYAVQSKEGPL